MKFSDTYRVMMKCEIGNGSTALFWSDLWKKNTFDIMFPRLFSYAKDKLISVQEVLNTESLFDLFHLPLSIQALEELRLLEGIIDQEYSSEDYDKWIEPSGKKLFCPRMVYKL